MSRNLVSTSTTNQNLYMSNQFKLLKPSILLVLYFCFFSLNSAKQKPNIFLFSQTINVMRQSENLFDIDTPNLDRLMNSGTSLLEPIIWALEWSCLCGKQTHAEYWKISVEAEIASKKRRQREAKVDGGLNI